MVKVTLPIEGFKEIEKRGTNVFFYHYDVVKDEENEVLECTESGVMVEGVPTYSKVVSAIITDKYSIDAQIAILANKDDGDPKHAEEFSAFEAWRAFAKSLARQVVPATVVEVEE